MKGVSSLKNRKQYSPEFKLQVVKDYLNSEKSLNDIANEYSISSNKSVHGWVKKYVDSGYDDYESAGIIKSDSNNSDDSALLKKKIEYYELLIKIQENEINLLKKTQRKVTFIGHYLLILKYRNYGVSISFLLNYYNISSSTFYIIPGCFLQLKEKVNLILKVFLLILMVKKFLMIILKNFYLICFLFLILLIQSFSTKLLVQRN